MEGYGKGELQSGQMKRVEFKHIPHPSLLIAPAAAGAHAANIT